METSPFSFSLRRSSLPFSYEGVFEPFFFLFKSGSFSFKIFLSLAAEEISFPPLFFFSLHTEGAILFPSFFKERKGWQVLFSFIVSLFRGTMMKDGSSPFASEVMV